MDSDYLYGAARSYYNNQNPKTLAELEKAAREWAIERFTPPPEHLCSWCGMGDSQNEANGYGSLIPVVVMMNDGEEGYARIKQYVCDEHLIFLQEEFTRLRFVNHDHGGTCFLEDRTCIGSEHYGECPTPHDDEEPEDVVPPPRCNGSGIECMLPVGHDDLCMPPFGFHGKYEEPPANVVQDARDAFEADVCGGTPRKLIPRSD